MHIARRGALAAGVLSLSLIVPLFVLTAPANGQAVAPAITPARITVDTPVAPGTELDLPPVVVRNDGTEPLVTTMRVVIDGEDTRDWISFDPSTFDLDAGEARVVEVTLEVPRDVLLGPRTVRLSASVRQDTDSRGVSVGLTAAVASLLVFEVGWPADGVVETSGGAVAGTSLRFLLAVPIAMLAGGLSWTAMTLLGRYEFSVRRKPPSD